MAINRWTQEQTHAFHRMQQYIRNTPEPTFRVIKVPEWATRTGLKVGDTGPVRDGALWLPGKGNYHLEMPAGELEGIRPDCLEFVGYITHHAD